MTLTPAERMARYRAENKEKIAEQTKRYRSTPEFKAKRAEYRKKNVDKIREANRLHRESAQTDPERFIGYLYGICKAGAKSRNIPFEITKEDIRELCIESNGKCALSGLPLSSQYHSPMKASIDRIDSNKGYTRDNVHLVGAMVNIAKNKYSIELFVEMCRGVSEKAGC